MEFAPGQRGNLAGRDPLLGPPPPALRPYGLDPRPPSYGLEPPPFGLDPTGLYGAEPAAGGPLAKVPLAGPQPWELGMDPFLDPQGAGGPGFRPGGPPGCGLGAERQASSRGGTSTARSRPP